MDMMETPTMEVDTQPEAEADIETADGESAAEEIQLDTADEGEPTSNPEPEGEGGTESGTEAAEEPTVSVKFNREFKTLSMEDAVTFAQKGMKYDSIAPMLETLKRIAAADGKTLNELVEHLNTSYEQRVYDSLLEECGGNESVAQRLFAAEKAKNKQAYEDMVANELQSERDDEESVTQRMAESFAELKAEFPQFDQFKDVPNAVLKEAVTKGIPLLDAYLRYQHRESIRAGAVASRQAAAAKASTGAQNNGTISEEDAGINAFVRGLWNS